MSFLIGMDIGGTNIVCGLVDEGGKLISKIKQPTEAHMGSGYVFDKISRMIQELLQTAQVESKDVAAIGVGTPGFIDPVRGITVFASNLQWTQVPTAEEIGKRTDIPTFIDNDVRMYVYGEAVAGAAKGYEHVLGITIGTGLAAAVVNNGELYYGGRYMAGELGHIPMPEIPYTCGCGLQGCLETLVSATGIARQAREQLEAGRASIMNDWLNGDPVDRITSADVSKAYDEGDPLAVEIMNHTGKLLGKGLAYAVSLYSPDIIVIGGGAALAGERLFAPMREQLQRSVYKGYWERLTIAPAQMIDDAGIVGSALAAGRRLKELRGEAV
ncbi:ROK family protein [Paenibacillus doosanensis]|uniref:Glucokinase n=1 Tax=Paenibacillus konkukensis TaxID=2020716 RepID=A0ABY4RVD5_9BACL|nr:MULTISPECIES: ROK family protein [Paenibacillus]MCS7458852.1 ROK family protein [Paenibacillus doosanensis]UQZ86619.1 Glucokinase [Paenibacillus konkukensis]